MYFGTGQVEDKGGILGWIDRGLIDPFKKIFTKEEEKPKVELKPSGKVGEPKIEVKEEEEPLWRKLLIPGLIVGGVIYITRRKKR
jgi:hypothetical protein